MRTETAPLSLRDNAIGRLQRKAGDLGLLSELPADLPTKLFGNAKRVRLAAGNILFRAGASGDSCYRVEDGLLKVMMARPGRHCR